MLIRSLNFSTGITRPPWLVRILLALVALPDLLLDTGQVDGPQEDVVPTRSSQLTVVLPCNVHDLARLSEGVEGVLLNCVWVPYEDVRVVAT